MYDGMIVAMTVVFRTVCVGFVFFFVGFVFVVLLGGPVLC